MIDCSHYRRSMLAEPQNPDGELRAHRESCADCARFTDGLMRFESRLACAVRLDAGAPRRAMPRGSAPRTWFAIAAGVLLAVGAGLLWLAAPRSSLAADVVGHMGGEPAAWARTDVPVAAARLQAVLDDARMRLTPAAGMVSYANSCVFRGYRVPHFVVQTDRGPVTVMVLIHESVPAPTPFDEQGYRGTILPVPGHGAVAILTRGADGESLDRIAARLLSAIVWRS